MEKSEYGLKCFSGLAPFELSDAFWSRCACPRVAFEEARAAVRLATVLARKASKDGLLALENSLQGIPYAESRVAFKQVVDGCDPAFVAGVQRTLLVLSCERGAPLLARVILAHGALLVQAGMAEDRVAEALCAYLGAEELEALLDGRR